MGLRESLRAHWREYLIEAWGLGTFMVSAGLFATLLEYPGSPLRQALPEPSLRRALMGLAMGMTAVGIIYSPWGQRSGAHINPAVTLTFLALRKIARADALFFILAQFAGGLAGVLLTMALLSRAFTEPPVAYVATLPGPGGIGVAFAAEAAISCGLMLTVLIVSNHMKLSRLTGVFAGVLVASYITLEAPVSGMSMNPARSFASAAPAALWSGLWVYFTAPVIGMLGAIPVYRLLKPRAPVRCAKLDHPDDVPCMHCNHQPVAHVVGNPSPEART